MSLLDILGNYYDSAASVIKEVPDYCEFTVTFTIKGFSGSSLQFNSVAHSDCSGPYDMPSYNLDTLELCNRFVPNFCVNRKVTSKGLREKFKVDVLFGDGTELAFDRVSSFNHLEPVAEWLGRMQAIPKKYSVTFKIKRYTDQDVRYTASLETTQGLHPKEYFAKIVDASFDSSRTPRSKYHVQNAFKFGTIKSMILKHYKKEEAIFLAEYLYGVKVPKNATYADFFSRLANRPQSDFGIRDVQILNKVVNIITSSVRPVNTTTELLKLNVKPATDLKRWYKKNEGLEELLKTD